MNRPMQVSRSYGKWLTESREARDTIRAMLAVGEGQREGWRGVFAVPPASAMARVLASFQRETDIPLEMPFFAMLHFVSGMLLDRGVKIQSHMGTVYPDLWNIVLASSGAGKTFAHDVIAEAAPVRSDFPEVASGAAFIEALRAHNRGLWFVDEIAQKLKKIEEPGGPMADIKDYLLRAYGYNRIERVTKKETITIDEPCLGILGLNTIESFMKALSAESLVDGFAQRFAFVIGEMNRPVRPDYNRARLVRECRKAFEQITAHPIHDVYVIEHGGVEAYRQAFDLLLGREQVPLSFFRRVMFRSTKYAALYHVMLGKDSATLDAEDIGWAARACVLHLWDMKKLLGQTSIRGVLDMAEKAKRAKARLAEKGQELTARTVRQYVRGAQEIGAAELAALVNGEEAWEG